MATELEYPRPNTISASLLEILTDSASPMTAADLATHPQLLGSPAVTDVHKMLGKLRDRGLVFRTVYHGRDQKARHAFGVVGHHDRPVDQRKVAIAPPEQSTAVVSVADLDFRAELDRMFPGSVAGVHHRPAEDKPAPLANNSVKPQFIVRFDEATGRLGIDMGAFMVWIERSPA